MQALQFLVLVSPNFAPVLKDAIPFDLSSISAADRVTPGSGRTENAKKLYDMFTNEILNHRKILLDDIEKYNDSTDVSKTQLMFISVWRLSILMRQKYEIWYKINKFLGSPHKLIKTLHVKIGEFIESVQGIIDSTELHNIAVRPAALALRDNLILTKNLMDKYS